MPTIQNYPLLEQIYFPPDLRKLEESQLEQVCAEVRRYLIEVVSKNGGHFAAGLGTIELTVALHYVFKTPYDRLVWDIGHQAYPHKILTGRRDQLHTIRKAGGLSGFLKRDESEYDTFGAGHSSTSISAALGMACSAALKGEDRDAVAIIGDGALTAGMAYEALNNAGDMDANLLVVLNDNEMSISPNVGALSNYLARILSGKTYMSVRENSKSVLSTAQPVRSLAKRWEEHMKGMVTPSTLFEELGFYYIGPIDGHDINTLVKTLQNMKQISGPRFLHVITQKGKGLNEAESDPCVYHAVSPFDLNKGMQKKPSVGKTYTGVFSDWICDMAVKDDKLVGITPAMREGSGLVEFSKQFPERYFDVGIAEQHAVTFAAGLACEGFKPVVAIYSTFLQRAYDQFIHDVCLQNLDVTFAIDRAGLVGADGATHAGSFDYSFLRCIPKTIVMAPSDEQECRNMLFTAYQYEGTACVRYPRGNGPGVLTKQTMNLIPIGKAQQLRNGCRVALLAFGSVLEPARQAAEHLNASLVNMRYIKPLDEKLIIKLAQSHDLLVTIEENAIYGGAGSAVNECLAKFGLNTHILNLGLPDAYLDHGEHSQMLIDCGLDAAGIINAVKQGQPSLLASNAESA